MSIACRTIQLLEPLPLGDPEIVTDTLSSDEAGVLALNAGVATYTVLFAVAKLSTNYEFIESDVSSTDVNPLAIVPTMTNRTTAGFTLQLDSLPDTEHYVFRWRAKLTSL